MYGNFMQKGIELAKQAAEEDNKQNWAQALELYTRAMEYFSTHLKYDKNPVSREMISNKFKEFLGRAEYIKAILDGRQTPDALVNNSEQTPTVPHLQTVDAMEVDDVESSQSTGEPYGSFMQRGIDLAKQAVEEDNKQNWAQALELYTRAMEYFSTHLKYDKNPKSREMISTKFNEYLQRAECIKGILNVY